MSLQWLQIFKFNKNLPFHNENKSRSVSEDTGKNGQHLGDLKGVVIQSLNRVRIFCDPMDCSPPGFSVRGILQARIVEWVAISFSRGFSPPRDGTRISRIDRWILYHWVTTLHMAITAWGTGGSTHRHNQLPSCYALAKWLPHSHRVGCGKFKDIYSLVPQSYHDNWIKWNSKRYSINPKEGI